TNIGPCSASRSLAPVPRPRRHRTRKEAIHERAVNSPGNSDDDDAGRSAAEDFARRPGAAEVAGRDAGKPAGVAGRLRDLPRLPPRGRTTGDGGLRHLLFGHQSLTAWW